MLRTWQSECLIKAKKHYQSQNHFMCLACPGAGKTVMAAEVAAYLLNEKLIDFALCFSPSLSVSQGITATFSRRLNCNFDGAMGSVGCSFTYHNMRYFDDSFWQIIRKHRVLVVFDEIHHCAGGSVNEANAWGEDIMVNIQENASYTLALTGTPWRSDSTPIVLAKYSDPDNKIQCDYSYCMKQAVQDGVCRSPKIVLIDNDEISVTTEKKGTKSFSSLADVLKRSKLSYQDVISHDGVLDHIIALSCSKLAEIRNYNPNAGGLIVASSVEHAEQIHQLLLNKFNQSSVIVTYKEQAPSDDINRFRNSSTQWIVSVGMVAEGTDIPRLQVCCHLSRVKTELYFRQVLGRILRVNNAINQEAWLFTFAEDKLSKFANRIGQELPDIEVLAKSSQLSDQYAKDNEALKAFQPKLDQPYMDAGGEISKDNVHSSKEADYLTAFDFFGGFRQKMIEAFY